MAFTLLSSCSNENSSDNELVGNENLASETVPEPSKTSVSIPASQLFICMKAYVGIDQGIYAGLFGDPMISGFRSALKNPDLGALIGNSIRQTGESNRVSSIYYERLQEFEGLITKPDGMKNAFMEDVGTLYTCDELFSQ